MAGKDGRAARMARLILVVAAGLGVLLMHTLGHTDGADPGPGMSMAASAEMVHAPPAASLEHLAAQATATAQQGSIPRPMPMDEMSICLAVLMMAVALIRLGYRSAAEPRDRQVLDERCPRTGAGERGPPPPLLSLLAARTVVLRN